ncbi:MAG: TolC family protein [Fermentimonas sp.]|nr:TolC family protein [Fermentimonas sp.]
MKTNIILIGTIFFLKCSLILSQNSISEVLQSIEDKNYTLIALRKTADAQMLENKTGIYLSNPEIDFGYLWGKPNIIGNRTDFSAMQAFDIPTITGMKSRLSYKQNVSVEMLLKAERMSILLDAKQLCIDLIYYNSIIEELEKRLSHAQRIAEIYEKRLSEGDANMLDLNKAQLNLLNAQVELQRKEVERDALLSKLMQLNGGEAISLNDKYSEAILLPPNFEEWYAHAEQINPVLLFVRQEVEVSKDFARITRAKRLPTFSAGFMSEKIVGETFQGIKVGISVPLWENKNQVAHAKASVNAAEARRADGIQKFYIEVKNQYSKAMGLNEISQNYRNLLSSSNSSDLLQKALEAGEISLLNYLNEISLYYDTVNLALEAERDFQKAIAQLLAVEL